MPVTKELTLPLLQNQAFGARIHNSASLTIIFPGLERKFFCGSFVAALSLQSGGNWDEKRFGDVIFPTTDLPAGGGGGGFTNFI